MDIYRLVPKTILYTFIKLIYNQDQKRTLYLGTGKDENGYVQTYNKFEEPTAYIGSNRDMDGVIVLNDRYGALGYTRTGKK